LFSLTLPFRNLIEGEGKAEGGETEAGHLKKH
jgi:hypothetical protein